MLLSEYQKPSRVHYEILLMCWLGWLFDFYDLVIYSFLISPIAKELLLSKLDSGYVLGTSLAASALGGIAFGILSDRCGRRTVLQWTIVVYSIGTLCTGFAWNLKSLLFFRFLTGLGVGGEWATGQTYVSETFPPQSRARYGAFLQGAAPIGVALAAIVGGFVQPHIGWRNCFFLSVAPALVIIAIRRRLPESDLWLQRKTSAVKSTQNPAPPGQLRTLLSQQHGKWFVFALILAIFDMSTYWLTFSWLPTYLNDERHLTIAQSSLWIIWTQIGIMVGCATFGVVADRIGRRPAYSIYCGLMAIGLMMITLLWPLIAAVPPVILLFMFLVGFGTGNFGGYGPLFSELFPTNVRSTALGSTFNIARGLQSFSPVIIAIIAQHYGLDRGISLAAIFALLTGIWIWTFPETKGWKLPS